MHNKASENRRFGEDSSSFQPIGAVSQSAETATANTGVATFPEVTPWYSLRYRYLWVNTEQLQPKQFLPTFAVNHPSQKTQVQLGAENIYRNFQLKAAERVIGSCTRQAVWYHFSLTYLCTTFLGSVTNGLTRLRVGRFLILSLMWPWKGFLLMPVSHSNCCYGDKPFIAPRWPNSWM